MNYSRQLSANEFAGSIASTIRQAGGFFPGFVKFWIWLAAVANLAGWSLSAIGQLNRTGYMLFFAAAAGISFVWFRPSWAWPRWEKLHRRFRRPLPCAFAVLACLIFLGGVYYPPSNYTGLSYRVARVLQWLDHGQWCWIHTPDYRMNDRACGVEWLYTPVMLFTKSDRALFLINYLPFLLLPGLIFSVFTGLGVRWRVAWYWMWLLPTGYDFLLQAGSIANDTFPTVFALAAFNLVLRVRTSGRIQDLWCSLVAIALLTGAKAGNVPLVVPWAILGFATLPLLKRRLMVSALVLLVAAIVSFLPTAVLNAIYCGDWTGAKLEVSHMAQDNAWTGIWGNAFQLALDNLAPPVLPVAGWWNHHATSVLPDFLVRAAKENFTSGFLTLGELPTEDWAGIGFGLMVLIMASVGAAFCIRSVKSPPVTPVPAPVRHAVLAASWVALVIYSAKSGMENAARIIAPYYPFLVASLVVGQAQSTLVRRRWWQRLAGGTVALAFVVLILSPDRPLWPAQSILSHLSSQYPAKRSIGRAQEVYRVYAERSDALAGVRAMLPPGIKTIGLVDEKDDNDIALWRPFGSRSVKLFLLTDPPPLIRSNVDYVVVGGFNLGAHQMTIDDWLQTNNAELVATTNATVKVAEGPQFWYLTRFKP